MPARASAQAGKSAGPSQQGGPVWPAATGLLRTQIYVQVLFKTREGPWKAISGIHLHKHPSSLWIRRLFLQNLRLSCAAVPLALPV